MLARLPGTLVGVPAVTDPPVLAPEGDPAAGPPASVGTRAAFLIGLVLLAALLAAAARAAPAREGQRVGRRVELAELIAGERQRAQALAARADELESDLRALDQPSEAEGVTTAILHDQIDAVAPGAGTTAVAGPGLVVTLDDSDASLTGVEDYNDLVVHEQDLQAVVNVLWAGGAEAVTVAGERILATSAIRCVGNVLRLHRGTYAPPYRVEAIGDEASLRAALEVDPVVSSYRAAVAEHGLGLEVVGASELLLPPYTGALSLSVARSPEVAS